MQESSCWRSLCFEVDEYSSCILFESGTYIPFVLSTSAAVTVKTAIGRLRKAVTGEVAV